MTQENNPYKLFLRLEITRGSDPAVPTVCILCREPLDIGGFYTLTMEPPSPIVHKVYFDERCFEQLISIGWKMYNQIPSTQETVN